jgi:hypothetical protein
MSEIDGATCAGCGWIYAGYPNDTGYCGPCARTRGLAPRTPESDKIDAKYAKARAEMVLRARDRGTWDGADEG